MRPSIFTVLGPTSPIYDLTTVEAVNAALGLDSNTADDAATAAQITHVSRMIDAKVCLSGQISLALLDVQESFRPQWAEQQPRLNLSQWPILAVDSITVDGSTINTNEYEIDNGKGMLHQICGYWRGEVVVTYSGGFDLPTDAPPLLAQAAIEWVNAQRLAIASSGTDPNIRTIQHGDSMVSFFDAAATGTSAGAGGGDGIPSSVSGLIQQYKRLTA